MNKTGLVTGILLMAGSLSVQAEEATRFDYLDLPIEPTVAASVETGTLSSARDYLDLPVESRSSEVAAVEPRDSQVTDCLDLPIEKAAVLTVNNNPG